MTAELTPDVKTLALVLLAATLGLVLFVPTASAQQATCMDVLENESDRTDGASGPGGLLADAISDQRSAIGSQLDDGSLDARLENATSTRERARIVADEVERLEANVSTLERCWGRNRSAAVDAPGLSELDDDERATLENHTASLNRTLNETRTAAERLPESYRATYDVDEERLTSLERRLVAVRNETDRQPEPPAASDDPFSFP